MTYIDLINADYCLFWNCCQKSCQARYDSLVQLWKSRMNSINGPKKYNEEQLRPLKELSTFVRGECGRELCAEDRIAFYEKMKALEAIEVRFERMRMMIINRLT